jgi:hypothetical protein
MASKTRRVRPMKKADPGPVPQPTPVPPRPAPSRLPALRSIFAAAGIEVVESVEPTTPWRIAGRFNYWPLSHRWATDDYHPLSKLATGRQGYGAQELVNLIRDEQIAPGAVAAVEAALTGEF